MTTFYEAVVDEEMKAWRHASFMEEIGLMGYDSYQEYLDDMAYQESINPLCD